MIGAILLLVGALCWLLAWLGSRGSLPRNRVFGMRTRATMASDAAWDAAHRASAGLVGAAGTAFAAGGAWTVLADPSGSALEVTALIVTAIALVLVIAGGVVAQRAAMSAGPRG